MPTYCILIIISRWWIILSVLRCNFCSFSVPIWTVCVSILARFYNRNDIFFYYNIYIKISSRLLAYVWFSSWCFGVKYLNFKLKKTEVKLSTCIYFSIFRMVFCLFMMSPLYLLTIVFISARETHFCIKRLVPTPSISRNRRCLICVISSNII